MEVEARWATIDDIDNLVCLRLDYFASENKAITYKQREALETRLRDYFKAHLAVDFFAPLIVIDGQIAATAFLSIFERPANLSWPTGRTGTVYNVFTYPAFRRNGYAEKAMRMLMDVARQQDLSFIDLSASKMGLALYQKLGFEVIDHAASHFTDMKCRLI